MVRGRKASPAALKLQLMVYPNTVFTLARLRNRTEPNRTEPNRTEPTRAREPSWPPFTLCVANRRQPSNWVCLLRLALCVASSFNHSRYLDSIHLLGQLCKHFLIPPAAFYLTLDTILTPQLNQTDRLILHLRIYRACANPRTVWLAFTLHNRTEPNRTVLARQLEVGQVSPVRLGSVRFGPRSHYKVKPNRTVPNRAGTVKNPSVNGV